MNDERRNEIKRAALEHWGEELQVNLAIEEMSELTHALLKYRRRPSEDREDHVREEIADVLIMLDQLLLIYDHDGTGPGFSVDDWTDMKLERTANRMGLT
jgi:NTP pyrophosphatase (non-canonical NTP hydrolase)